jgi:hypothetical protein
VLGKPGEIGLQALGADIIHTFGDDAQGMVDLAAVGGPSLPAPGAAAQALTDQPGKALAVEVGDLHHLVQHLAPLCSAGLQVVGLEEAQVLAAFRDGHLVIGGHRSLGTPSRCPFGNILI